MSKLWSPTCTLLVSLMMPPTSPSMAAAKTCSTCSRALGSQQALHSFNIYALCLELTFDTSRLIWTCMGTGNIGGVSHLRIVGSRACRGPCRLVLAHRDAPAYQGAHNSAPQYLCSHTELISAGEGQLPLYL